VAVDGDGVSVPDTTTVAKAMASSTTSGAPTGDPAASTGLAAGAPTFPPRMVAATTLMGTDDNAIEVHEVIMGHPDHGA
jgi:hypothetical protein